MLRSGKAACVNSIKSLTKSTLGRFGYELTRRASVSHPEDYATDFPVDFDEETKALIKQVEPYTMTSPEKILALREALKYIVRSKIPGDIVECGVWRGGSIIVAAHTLLGLGHTSMHMHLYDTFEGMTKPTEVDVDFAGLSALEDWDQNRLNPFYAPARAPIDEVKSLVFATGYPQENFHFIKGPVEQTLPKEAPRQIALLRLDTDWYESTKHELVHLYPLLSPGGVLILDDYGHFEGARKAADEYFQEQGINVLLNRIDYSGRLAIKPLQM
ncbi:MAG TPA: TylF/MycF/NovP-related O-methyltransferase [Dehalococcoidia bacterium]|nr:TylF/MycF/NovP-related O-methyltransferase [Dehalococcoidia bacterium]